MTKKAEMQKELMALYKKNGHNPMGGCLPMLLQMPIFLALWSMLNNVFELRHAPFFGWIVVSDSVVNTISATQSNFNLFTLFIISGCNDSMVFNNIRLDIMVKLLLNILSSFRYGYYKL